MIFKNNAYRINTDADDIVETFRKSYSLEKKLATLGYKVAHCTESKAKEDMTMGSYEATLYLPKVNKDQVLELAQDHKVLTPKATRHRLPARPVAVNAPLSLLRDKKISIEEANKKLYMLLKDKKLTRYDPGTEWMGRTYDEVLYVFSDS